MHGLRPTCDSFASHLRTQLRAAVPLMKSIKPLLNTFYSEVLVSESPAAANGKGKERERNDEGLLETPTLIDTASAPDFTTTGGLGNGWHGGLCVRQSVRVSDLSAASSTSSPAIRASAFSSYKRRG